MKYDKKPIDFSQQIETLRERGMVIEDESRALSQLSSISYFRLANYWRMMEDRSDPRFFSPNTRFEDVVYRYVFDRKLRDLIFTAIQVRRSCYNYSIPLVQVRLG